MDENETSCGVEQGDGGENEGGVEVGLCFVTVHGEGKRNHVGNAHVANACTSAVRCENEIASRKVLYALEALFRGTGALDDCASIDLN